MMYCEKCGSILHAGDQFCPECGMRVNPEPQQQPQQANNYNNYNGYNNSQPYYPQFSAQDKEVDAAQTMGIFSIVLAVIGFSIIGLIVGILGMNKLKPIKESGYETAKEKDAERYNKIGVIISAIRLALTALFILLWFIFSFGAVFGN